MAAPITGAMGHILTGVAQLSARTRAPGPMARRAPAAPSDRVTRSMTTAALTGPLPDYEPVQDDDHDVQSGAARQRYSSLGLSSSHPFQYTTASIPYPPTAPYLKNPPEGIEAVFGPSVKYYDMKLTAAQAPNTLERFEISSFSTRQSTRAADTNATQASTLNKYHTEHVFEIHFVKDFLVWAVNNQMTTMDDLEHFFFRSTDVESSNGINQLLQQLSWWDVDQAKPVDPIGPRYKEFFVLEAQLNLLKGQILFPGDTAETQRQFFPKTMPAGQALANARGTVQAHLDPTWQQLYMSLRDVALVFQYMNLPEVRKVFLQVYSRFVSYFGHMGDAWHVAFQTWMKAFLAGRQAAIRGYYTQTLHQIQITLSDMATHETDAGERGALQQTWSEISTQLSPASFQFHSDYPH